MGDVAWWNHDKLNNKRFGSDMMSPNWMVNSNRRPRLTRAGDDGQQKKARTEL